MIYIVTSGEYSDFVVECVVERDTLVTPEEQSRMAEDRLALSNSRAHDKCWADVLCEKYGFRHVPNGEIWHMLTMHHPGANWTACVEIDQPEDA